MSWYDSLALFLFFKNLFLSDFGDYLDLEKDF